jgi:hypothetical protein
VRFITRVASNLKENIILRLKVTVSYLVSTKKGLTPVDGNEWDLDFIIYDVDKDEYFVAV